jgi:hypothetical protein
MKKEIPQSYYFGLIFAACASTFTGMGWYLFMVRDALFCIIIQQSIYWAFAYLLMKDMERDRK